MSSLIDIFLNWNILLRDGNLGSGVNRFSIDVAMKSFWSRLEMTKTWAIKLSAVILFMSDI